MRKANLVGGLLLILFGVAFLAGNFGYIEPGFFYRLGQLWPLWLIVAGLMIMARNYPVLRFGAGAVVVLMILAAVFDPLFLDGLGGYRYGRDFFPWRLSSFWGLLFLAGAVWVLYILFGRNPRHEAQ